jgi:hypothetical protein
VGPPVIGSVLGGMVGHSGLAVVATTGDADLAPEAWVDAFVTHVIQQVPHASRTRTVAKAESLYTRLGEYGPAEVAEAVLGDWPSSDFT